MKAGQVLKCIKPKVNYLTKGKKYVISSGSGDYSVALGSFGERIASGFDLIDDCGDAIFQHSLSGIHGDFEVVE